MSGEFSEWLFQAMLERDITQAELAARAGLSQASISLILSKKRNVGADSCERIARVLNLPIDDVYRRAGLLPAIALIDERDREISEISSKLTSDNKDELLEQARLRLRLQVRRDEKK